MPQTWLEGQGSRTRRSWRVSSARSTQAPPQSVRPAGRRACRSRRGRCRRSGSRCRRRRSWRRRSCSFTQAPLQQFWPAGQSVWQAPPPQTWPPGRRCRRRRSWPGRSARSTQAPLQVVWPAGQTSLQTPRDAAVCPPGSVPQPPQLARSLLLVHAGAAAGGLAAGQFVTQAPPPQTWPAGQAVPHAPQLCGRSAR